MTLAFCVVKLPCRSFLLPDTMVTYLGICKIAEYFLETFCQLFTNFSMGGERFSQLLATLYQAIVPLACLNLETTHN